jgi:hypothetical protein
MPMAPLLTNLTKQLRRLCWSSRQLDGIMASTYNLYDARRDSPSSSTAPPSAKRS